MSARTIPSTPPSGREARNVSTDDLRFEAHGFTTVIERDPDPINPRIMHDNASRMICWHRNYRLGDKHEYTRPADFETWWAEHGEAGERLPLYLYDHSGISMATTPFSCPWDSGQVGWIVMTVDAQSREFKGCYDRDEWLERSHLLMESEVEVYDRYLTGDVWLFTVEDGEQTFECCGGFESYTVAKAAALECADALERQALPLLDSTGLLDGDKSYEKPYHE